MDINYYILAHAKRIKMLQTKEKINDKYVWIAKYGRVKYGKSAYKDWLESELCTLKKSFLKCLFCSSMSVSDPKISKISLIVTG